jgi:hypothetical protein
MMDEIVGVKGLDAWFGERLHSLRFRPETMAYVAGVLKTLAHPREEDVFAKRSVILAYQDARLTGDFAEFQRIGDWVLWVDVILPQHLDGKRDAVEAIGRLSYYTCHRLLKGQWRVYEELADELPAIAHFARRKLV